MMSYYSNFYVPSPNYFITSKSMINLIRMRRKEGEKEELSVSPAYNFMQMNSGVTKTKTKKRQINQ